MDDGYRFSVFSVVIVPYHRGHRGAQMVVTLGSPRKPAPVPGGCPRFALLGLESLL
jgi:hypothetical protein